LGIKGDQTTAPLSLVLVGSSRHNSGNKKSISKHEPKIGERIGMISVYRRSGKITSCLRN
jgi:hypothetical protein